VRTVIVDEIHAVLGQKRGVHLAVSLERTCRLAEGPVQRIGLSATVRPEREAARFLGGLEDGTSRPVTIVDAQYEKPLDLKVVTCVEDFANLPGGSIWPSIIPELVRIIRAHRTTLIFCNQRRMAEQTADRLNAQLAAEAEGRVQPGESVMLVEEGVAEGRGIFGVGADGPVRAHHGSMSREARREMEQALKDGRLPAVVATSSLELGIDIGSVDVVVQIGSPHNVAQGLQRVGRSGHLVGQCSVGRIFPLHREDTIEAAAVARAMMRRQVEPTSCPRNCLDVLAQHIVAMASMEPWNVRALYQLIQQTYPYEALPFEAFTSVLAMLSGEYPSEAFYELRARVVWDRESDAITALPFARLLAIRNGGTIPDRGTFHVYLTDEKTKIGELDEEFVFETRPGDVFLLGSNVWRVTKISEDRVTVAPAAGQTPRMPFWRGEYPWRPMELGKTVGAFRRELTARVREAMETAEDSKALDAVCGWVEEQCSTDGNTARNIVTHVRKELEQLGAISSDATIVVESFDGAVGEPRVVVHSPFGGRVNGPWGLAIADILEERMGVKPEMMANNDGILFRFVRGGESPDVADVIKAMAPEDAVERILQTLPRSAVFGAQFRQDAARALMLPAKKGGRTPFWLQRLKAKDLLAVARRFPDFPIITETYRDCLRDVMDLEGLKDVLGRIQKNEVAVTGAETLVPSAVAASLLSAFAGRFVYEWDMPKAERTLRELLVSREGLMELVAASSLDDLLRPEAVKEVAARARRTDPAFHARSQIELQALLHEMGDLRREEIAERCDEGWEQWLQQLAEEGKAVEVDISGGLASERRWVSANHAAEYRAAFDAAAGERQEDDAQAQAIPARASIVRRFLAHNGPVTVEDIVARYGFARGWLSHRLEEWVSNREVVRLRCERRGPSDVCYLCASHFDQMHRRTLSIVRREVRPVPFVAYQRFSLKWQHVDPENQLSGPEALPDALSQLEGFAVPVTAWERDILPARLADFDPRHLQELLVGKQWFWVADGPSSGPPRTLFFVHRKHGRLFVVPEEPEVDLSEPAREAMEFLRSEGEVLSVDVEDALEWDRRRTHAALTELACVGLATTDWWEWLVVAQKQASTQRRTQQRADRDVASTRRGTPAPRPARKGWAYQEIKRRVSMRITQTLPWKGRWFPVRRFSIMGKERPPEEIALRHASKLLKRWGIVTKAALARELGIMDWGPVFHALQLMEMRGQALRGYFVEGLPGIQFASPEAVEMLRACAETEPKSEICVVVNACDPANVTTGTDTPTPGSSLARVPSNYLVFIDGLAVLLCQRQGLHIRIVRDVPARCIELALRALTSWLGRPKTPAGSPTSIRIEKWNGRPILSAEGLPILHEIGYRRDASAMTWSG